MKTRPRMRRGILWGSVVVSAALAALWMASMVWTVGWRTKGPLSAGVVSGGMGVTWSSLPGAPGAVFRDRRSDEPTIWWVQAGSIARTWWMWVPIWMPLAVSLCVTAAAWRMEVLSRRRERIGKCASCGYDRAGLKAGAVCPECGAGIEREERERCEGGKKKRREEQGMM